MWKFRKKQKSANWMNKNDRIASYKTLYKSINKLKRQKALKKMSIKDAQVQHNKGTLLNSIKRIKSYLKMRNDITNG